MRRWVRQYWHRINQRVRGVADGFVSPTATPAVLNPLANDQGASLRITHINNRPVVIGVPLDFTTHTVTVALGGVVTITAVGGFTGRVSVAYTFTDGRTSGVAQLVGEFT